MTQAIVKGSLGAIAKQTGHSLAQTFLGCDVVCLVDTSGSMAARDSVGGRSRYDQACYELATLQESLPGKIAVISFSDSAVICPGGQPEYLSGGTDLAGALRFAKIADVPGAMRFIVISDGQPEAEDAALKIAASYHNRIDVIFVGAERDTHAREFMQRLARASGGKTVTAAQAKQLADSVQKLLAA